MLDEEHEKLPYDVHDTTIYTLRRMGEHNIFVTCLPDGKNGTTSAAGVAIQMMLTFESIHFGR